MSQQTSSAHKITSQHRKHLSANGLQMNLPKQAVIVSKTQPQSPQLVKSGGSSIQQLQNMIKMVKLDTQALQKSPNGGALSSCSNSPMKQLNPPSPQKMVVLAAESNEMLAQLMRASASLLVANNFLQSNISNSGSNTPERVQKIVPKTISPDAQKRNSSLLTPFRERVQNVINISPNRNGISSKNAGGANSPDKLQLYAIKEEVPRQVVKKAPGNLTVSRVETTLLPLQIQKNSTVKKCNVENSLNNIASTAIK